MHSASLIEVGIQVTWQPGEFSPGNYPREAAVGLTFTSARAACLFEAPTSYQPCPGLCSRPFGDGVNWVQTIITSP